ncbi:Abi-alpha family protein [Mycobacterium aquaticum]|uniref:DUF4393 domain-containing protein n=1 Tax=Mycobacterium aquaticum TaxID=1927124 RepID=A0A1X0AVZ3_9MYCO|nr:Abi-alpha family protein [Mycobacterium aquaticum]ORA34169.1 hypothetical protein BST13_17560 [Mycobacterium aquaticum]
MAHKGKKKDKRPEPTDGQPLGLINALGEIALGATKNVDPRASGGRHSADGRHSVDRSDDALGVVTNALTDVARALRGEPAPRDEGEHSGKAASDDVDASVKPLGALGILGNVMGLPNNPVTDAMDTVANVAMGPVLGAGQLAAAPLTGVTEALGRVLGTQGSAESAAALRKRGSALIRISYQPDCQRRDMHPSFLRIIDELLPDEARILRFMAVAGTQPVIDVRTKTLFQIGSVLLASGITMVAQMAGCHWPDRDHHYFANLHRLGLLNFSREPVDDYRRYALLEVQPAAVHAIESVPKAVTIYRSLRLTPFGEQFIEVCFDTEGYHAGGWDTDGRQDKIIGKGPPALRHKD